MKKFEARNAKREHNLPPKCNLKPIYCIMALGFSSFLCSKRKHGSQKSTSISYKQIVIFLCPNIITSIVVEHLYSATYRAERIRRWPIYNVECHLQLDYLLHHLARYCTLNLKSNSPLLVTHYIAPQTAQEEGSFKIP